MTQPRTLVTSSLFESELLLVAKRGLPIVKMQKVIDVLLQKKRRKT